MKKFVYKSIFLMIFCFCLFNTVSATNYRFYKSSFTCVVDSNNNKVQSTDTINANETYKTTTVKRFSWRDIYENAPTCVGKLETVDNINLTLNDIPSNYMVYYDGTNIYTRFRPTKSGYKFKGWKDSNGGIYAGIKITISESATSYTYTAVWEQDWSNSTSEISKEQGKSDGGWNENSCSNTGWISISTIRNAKGNLWLETKDTSASSAKVEVRFSDGSETQIASVSMGYHGASEYATTSGSFDTSSSYNNKEITAYRLTVCHNKFSGYSTAKVTFTSYQKKG